MSYNNLFLWENVLIIILLYTWIQHTILQFFTWTKNKRKIKITVRSPFHPSDWTNSEVLKRSSVGEWKSLSHVRLFGFTVHEILQARILEWVAFPFSRGPSQLRDRTCLPHCRRILYQLSHKGSPSLHSAVCQLHCNKTGRIKRNKS